MLGLDWKDSASSEIEALDTVSRNDNGLRLGLGRRAGIGFQLS